MSKVKNKSSSDHVKVFVRIRPGNEEKSTLTVFKKRDLVVTTSTYSKRFQFDQVFAMDSNQKEIYEAVVSPIITEVLKGYSCTVFAYGQTGTGKTYTMHGPLETETNVLNDKNGIIPRSIKHIFDKLVTFDEGYVVSVSFLELYNEEIFDLLSSDTEKKFRLYEDKKSASVIVQDLKEIVIKNPFDVFKLLSEGSRKRQTAQTLLNANSSRSHSLFTVTIQMREGVDYKKVGKLNIVDLAGSENISRSGVIDKGAREASNINKSLLTLGRVMTALADRALHIPYRESKLTRILQDSLNGRAKTSIIATVSAATINVEETLNTLEYANRARSITLHPEINQRLPYESLMKDLQEKLREKEALLQMTVQQKGIYLAPEQYQKLMSAADQAYKMNETRNRNELLIQKNAELENEVANLQEKNSTLLGEKRELEDEIERDKQQMMSELDHHVQEIRTLSHKNFELELSKNQLTKELDEVKQQKQKLQDEKTAIEERASTITNATRILRTRLDNIYTESNINLKTFEESSQYLEQKFKEFMNIQRKMTDTAVGNVNNYKSEIHQYVSELRVVIANMTSYLSLEFQRNFVNVAETIFQNFNQFHQRNVDDTSDYFRNILEPLVTQMSHKWNILSNGINETFNYFKEITNEQSASIENLESIIKQMEKQLEKVNTVNERLVIKMNNDFDETCRKLEELSKAQICKKRKYDEILKDASTTLKQINCAQVIDSLSDIRTNSSKIIEIFSNTVQVKETNIHPELVQLTTTYNQRINSCEQQTMPINKIFFENKTREIDANLNAALETKQNDINCVLGKLEIAAGAREISNTLQQFRTYFEQYNITNDNSSGENEHSDRLNVKFIPLKPTGETPDRTFIHNFVNKFSSEK